MNVIITGIIKTGRNPIDSVLTHKVKKVIIVTINIFIMTLVIEKEILIIVNDMTEIQYKYLIVSVILM